jgi:hypothetical protein
MLYQSWTKLKIGNIPFQHLESDGVALCLWLYLCLIGWVYVFYVDKSTLYETLFNCNILSRHHRHECSYSLSRQLLTQGARFQKKFPWHKYLKSVNVSLSLSSLMSLSSISSSEITYFVLKSGIEIQDHSSQPLIFTAEPWCLFDIPRSDLIIRDWQRIIQR